MKKQSSYREEIDIMNKVIIQLGGNRGDVLGHFEYTLNKLTEKGVFIGKKSKVYETEPWGHTDNRWFLNQVVEIETSLEPEELLDITQAIEKELGRTVKKSEWLYEGRPIDIDILFFNQETIHSERLMVPHPHIRFRKFVLTPLCDEWKNMIHPEFGLSMKELLERCHDESGIRLFEPEKKLN
ncbi:2-amino-4-hydroxy-6-hydroxymethyldihydropteridine diphosphokinase [Breznakibacter xylanolyticus]|uniref:2-amino-4-hydroxy-6-hydroxymethyldihydropteridine pyrophosphokinase n=1 Tax=Breznakibacter xylanolyticus TaxID=990 RepID=A0A2W7N3G2_9BACT|nr:2-amino-4-hydroxy-6-hydroxymethyldihydropteridine diphosphokinase [Breznakibacter xylanolyticus]MBN2744983.1 2-amino-4-hydroxy-6-hydroxymethyldihydropteridine diphosphokinase [Marinilabiliaceae bacterium]PZX14985.1 2-amino-4-hydroxy-6-hydroxymethyldihydropteridine diphosphokinase [Breznakibacter xylanolyticus]